MSLVLERESLLAGLDVYLDEALGGRGRLVFLGGEAGAGKSTLVGTFTERVGGRVRVLRGACDGGSAPRPLGPLADIAAALGPAVAEQLDLDRPSRGPLFAAARAALGALPTLFIVENVAVHREATASWPTRSSRCRRGPDPPPAWARAAAAIPAAAISAGFIRAKSRQAEMVEISEIEVWNDVGGDRLPQLMKLFADAWWARERSPDDVARMVAASDLVFGLVHRASGRLVGFARVLTDDVYLALVLDVVVAAGFRGTGLGAMLMDAVVGHPRVAGVRSVELVCQPDLLAFYRRWGFTEQVGESRLMRRITE